jgi:hypothetical protein
VPSAKPMTQGRVSGVVAVGSNARIHSAFFERIVSSP